MKAITVAESVYVDGRWVDAHWEVQAVDGGSGELLITASAAGRDLVLRMDMELARDLRGQAGFDGPLPVDEARAELAYWREIVEFAVRLLAKGRAAGQNIVTQSGHAEEYLRGLLALDGMPPEVGAPEPCYDCRTTGDRLAVLEDRLQILSDTMRRIVASIDGRLDALEATYGTANT